MYIRTYHCTPLFQPSAVSSLDRRVNHRGPGSAVLTLDPWTVELRFAVTAQCHGKSRGDFRDLSRPAPVPQVVPQVVPLNRIIYIINLKLCFMIFIINL